ARRHLVENLRLEQANHPVTIILVSRVGVDVKDHVTGGLVPGENRIKTGAVELDDTDVSHRAAGSATWLYMIERMPGLLAACRNNRFLAVSCLKLHITLEQVNGGAIRLATGEQNLA